MKGQPYLQWPLPYLQKFLANIDEILFIPYAGVTISYDEYTAAVAGALAATHTTVTGIHTLADKPAALHQAQAIAVGGGNTFHLLATLQQENLLAPVRAAVAGGTPYAGWSAGANVACPTLMTTNDMPIAQPADFKALNLIDFQINAHYTTKTIPGHGGESRDMRIRELLTLNPEMKVVGLPEGNLLALQDDQWYLRGIATEPTLLFTAGKAPLALATGKVPL